MKIIKLDNRYKYTKHGFTTGIIFDSCIFTDALKTEKFLMKQYGSITDKWVGYNSSNKYIVCVKDESVISLLLLAIA